MNNFQVAVDATATAMDSAGSAMKENTSYMESLEAQTTQLKATFQDFANNVIDKELVSSILTLANDALGALNTETGKTITQWGLLTGVLTGGIVIYGQIAGKLLSAGSAVVTLGKALSAGTATATMFTSAALPFAAALSTIAVVGWEVYKWYKETHKPLQEYTDEIQANTQQLEQNRDRLAEIEQMPWTEKTPEILDEYDALVQQNEELQRNIDLLEERRNKQATRQARKGGEVATGGTYYTAVGYDDFTQYKDAETAYLSLASANQLVVESAEDAKQQLEAIGITLQENAEMVKVDADAYNEDLTASMQNYADQLNSTHSLNQDQLRDFESLKITVSERVEGLKLLEAQGDTLTESERNLIDVYDSLIETEAQAKEWTEKYGDALVITDEQAQQLIKTFPALKNQLIDTGSGWTILNNSAQAAANGLISADGRIKASSKDRTKSVLEDLNATITYYGLIARAFATMGTKSGYTATQATQANELARSFDATRKQLQAAIARSEKFGYFDDTPKSLTSPTLTTKNATTKKATDLALEEFKNLQKDLEHQKELGLIKEKDYYDKLEQLIKNYKAKATAHMKEYGTDVDTINRNMYQYEEEIYKGRAKLADDLAEQQKKATEDALEAQQKAAEEAAEALEKAEKEIKQAYEDMFEYLIGEIDEELDVLNEQLDEIDKKYDDELKRLEAKNELTESQVELEEKLNKLAKARSQKLLVYKDGRFQYISDVDTISQATEELEEYNRQQLLKQQKEDIENRRELEKKDIQSTIDALEKKKKAFNKFLDDYRDYQKALDIEQKLGINLEKDNWKSSLSNLRDYMTEYDSILGQISSSLEASVETQKQLQQSLLDNQLRLQEESIKAQDEYISKLIKAQDECISKLAERNKIKETLLSGGSISFTGAGGQEGHIYLDHSSANKPTGYYDSKGNALTKGQVEDYVGTVGGKVYDSSGKSYDANTVKLNKHAEGTTSSPGGLSLVGEKGPELRVLNSGDGIIPADATRNLWDWAKFSPKEFNGGTMIHIANLNLPNVRDGNDFVKYMVNNFWRETVQYAST